MPIVLTLCMLGNSTCFLLSTVFFLQNLHFRKILSGIYHQSVIQFGNIIIISSDLAPNSLQRLSEDNKSRP